MQKLAINQTKNHIQNSLIRESGKLNKKQKNIITILLEQKQSILCFFNHQHAGLAELIQSSVKLLQREALFNHLLLYIAQTHLLLILSFEDFLNCLETLPALALIDLLELLDDRALFSILQRLPGSIYQINSLLNILSGNII